MWLALAVHGHAASRVPLDASGSEPCRARQPSLTLANECVSYGWQAARRLSTEAAKPRRRTTPPLARARSNASVGGICASACDRPSEVPPRTDTSSRRERLTRYASRRGGAERASAV